MLINHCVPTLFEKVGLGALSSYFWFLRDLRLSRQVRPDVLEFYFTILDEPDLFKQVLLDFTSLYFHFH